MPRYFFDMIGIDVDDIGLECENLGEARNAAISYLGEYCATSPNMQAKVIGKLMFVTRIINPSSTSSSQQSTCVR